VNCRSAPCLAPWLARTSAASSSWCRRPSPDDELPAAISLGVAFLLLGLFAEDSLDKRYNRPRCGGWPDSMRRSASSAAEHEDVVRSEPTLGQSRSAVPPGRDRHDGDHRRRHRSGTLRGLSTRHRQTVPSAPSTVLSSPGLYPVRRLLDGIGEVAGLPGRLERGLARAGAPLAARRTSTSPSHSGAQLESSRVPLQYSACSSQPSSAARNPAPRSRPQSRPSRTQVTSQATQLGRVLRPWRRGRDFVRPGLAREC